MRSVPFFLSGIRIPLGPRPFLGKEEESRFGSFCSASFLLIRFFRGMTFPFFPCYPHSRDGEGRPPSGDRVVIPPSYGPFLPLNSIH